MGMDVYPCIQFDVYTHVLTPHTQHSCDPSTSLRSLGAKPRCAGTDNIPGGVSQGNTLPIIARRLPQ